MTIVAKILSFITKSFLFVFFTLLMLVPVIYVLGNEQIYRPSWRIDLQKFKDRSLQIDQIRKDRLTNIYLQEEKEKIGWSQIIETLNLADYVSYQLNQRQVAVVRRILPFKEPKKNKPIHELDQLQYQLSQDIYTPPQLQSVKNMVEKYIEFEHKSLKQKQWIIIAFAEVSNEFAEEINQILQKNQNDRIVIVSTFPTSSKRATVKVIRPNGTAVDENTKIKNKNSKNKAQNQSKPNIENNKEDSEPLAEQQDIESKTSKAEKIK